MVDLIVGPVTLAFGTLTARIAAELQRLRRRPAPPPAPAFPPPRPPGLHPAVARLLVQLAEVDESRALEWRRRSFGRPSSWPRLGLLMPYLIFTHAVDHTVSLMARAHERRQPYTLREILSWPAIGRKDLQTRQATLGWSMDAPN